MNKLDLLCELRMDYVIRMENAEDSDERAFYKDFVDEMSLLINIEYSKRRPYDNGYNNDGDWTYVAARGTIHELRGRAFIGDVFDNIPPALRRDIVRSLANIIRTAHANEQNKPTES